MEFRRDPKSHRSGPAGAVKSPADAAENESRSESAASRGRLESTYPSRFALNVNLRGKYQVERIKPGHEPRHSPLTLLDALESPIWRDSDLRNLVESKKKGERPAIGQDGPAKTAVRRRTRVSAHQPFGIWVASNPGA